MRKIIFLFVLSFCVFVQGDEEDELKLGSFCDFHEDCDNITNAICSSNDVCECTEGYLASPNNFNCLPLAAKIGDKCEIAEQCSNISSAVCLNNTCTLPKAVTVLQPAAKEACTEDSQCSSFLVKGQCKNATCVPPISPKFLLVAPKSEESDTFVLNKPCHNETECLAEGADCIDKLCRCTENFVPAQNLKKCLPKANSVGDKCLESVQCFSLNGSICENEKCSQKITKVLESFGANEIDYTKKQNEMSVIRLAGGPEGSSQSACLKAGAKGSYVQLEQIKPRERRKISPLLIGSTCQTDNECKHLTHALCLENVCQCEDSYITSVASNSCLKKATKEGDPCDIDKQCEDIKGATCIQNKCVKPGVVGTKLGKENIGSTQTVSKLILAAILFVKMFFA